jgi:NAD(P)-dependent dehydrogenase (short-subunit alcohol dehydrogenase family)
MIDKAAAGRGTILRRRGKEDAMSLTAKGMRVVVTAGGTGIGRVIAQTFKDNGARVHVCDILPEAIEECRQAGLGATLADVSDVKQVSALFDEAEASLGGLDVLINNAGLAGPFSGIENIEIADWERTIAVNLNGMFYCLKRAVPLLKAAGGGLVVNMSSVAGRLGFPFRSPYSASKWAIVGLTQTLAMELGPDNIRVNAIQPGIVDGERHWRNAKRKAALLGITLEEQETRVLSRVSLRRMVSPQDVGNMALYLASDLGKTVSGQALSVCGNVESMAP